ncbi:glycosyltransferase family 8 protein [Lophiostoma macrostomum CBS 122681]|uniref:Glycosyltransferase family 8 protein n=1 Tax=Lophiostoma macrostomum CBS 122681 TaxID=1314788 RepID=A0A6A6STX8_9PLEO|nr:glycosyltransferase family 8 protein [Lophiostoma macrostomum CBS 122681]
MSDTQERKIQGKYAYATLLTRPSYLAGAVLLAYTLTKHSPSTPLVILYTPETLPEPCVSALRTEARFSNLILHAVDHLRVPPTTSSQNPNNSSDANGKPTGMVAARFLDTWTKLRVFSPSLFALFPAHIPSEECQLCFLDADMMIFRDPSPAIFSAAPEPRPREPLGLDEVLASHVCVCNLDNDTWAPREWTRANCAYTPITTSSADEENSIPPASTDPPTHALFNSGTFVFRPTPSISTRVFDAFERLAQEGELAKLAFPDQDFLNRVFEQRWRSLHWSCNALKTWRYWHRNMWSDKEVRVLHYIVDKPWAKRVRIVEKLAGYRGDDGETHSWWWDEYALWKAERADQGTEARDEVKLVGRYVDGEQEGLEQDEDMKAIGGGAQDFAKKWEGKNDGKTDGGEKDAGADKKEDEGKDSAKSGPVLRKPMLGERGHGPVVRGGFGGTGRGGRGSGFITD